MKRIRQFIMIFVLGITILSGYGCTSSAQPSTQTQFFDDVTQLCEQDDVEFVFVQKDGIVMSSSMRYTTDTDAEVESTLSNYFNPVERDLIDPLFIDIIELGINSRNQNIYYLLDQINDHSVKLESDASFDNNPDNPMIKTDELLLYIDGNDHIKVSGVDGATNPLSGIYQCEGIYEKLLQFEADQYTISTILAHSVSTMNSKQ